MEDEIKVVKRKEAIANFAKDILGNVAVVGIGLALYQEQWWCLVIATFAVAIGTIIIWRT